MTLPYAHRAGRANLVTAFLRLLAFVLLLTAPAFAADMPAGEPPAASAEVPLYFFWSENCPHCRNARPHVEAIVAGRPWVRLYALELSRHPENLRRFETLLDETGRHEEAGVPAFLVCGELLFGWESMETTGAWLAARLDACHAGAPPPATATPPAVTLPGLGEVDPARLSLPVLTLTLAGLDAFNPCAFFVLLFLLSMLTHQKSRARMLAIGGAFVVVSGGMYFAFMAAWLNVFQLFGHLAWVTAAAGVLALAVGVFNVKDFIAFGRGPSLSISDTHKADLFRRMRALLSADSLPAMLAATLFLAVAANFYELLCTAGFPMVYTRVLTLSGVEGAGRYAWLALYNLIYVLPLAAIVAVFAATLGARKLGERGGRLLKLLSGVMMLELGALLIFAPDWLNRLGIAVFLLVVAVGVTALAARFTRRDG